MNERKERFTPGPWYISTYETRKRMTILDRQLDHYDPRHTIATVCRAKGHETANAALMVKAPDMYEELEKTASYLRFVAKWIEGQHGVIAIGESLKYKAEIIDKLLAKARGEEEHGK